MVGPVIRGLDADLADAVIEAIEADNPDADVVVDDEGGYIRIGAPQPVPADPGQPGGRAGPHLRAAPGWSRAGRRSPAA